MSFHSIVKLVIYSERGDRDLKGLLLFCSNTVPTALYVTENIPKQPFWTFQGAQVHKVQDLGDRKVTVELFQAQNRPQIPNLRSELRIQLYFQRNSERAAENGPERPKSQKSAESRAALLNLSPESESSGDSGSGKLFWDCLSDVRKSASGANILYLAPTSFGCPGGLNLGAKKLSEISFSA